MKPLLDDDELARLAERARLDVHTGVKGEPRAKGDDDEYDDEADEAALAREHARFHRGLSTLRFAAEAYAVESDARGLTPVVWAAWAIHKGHFDVRLDSASVLAAAVKSVGARVFEVPGLAQALAGSDLTPVRLALASALSRGGEADAILLVLAHDVDPEVRAEVARKNGPIDPWDGAFPIAPDGHSDEVLAAARAVLEAPWFRLAPEDAVRAFAPLSDALAVACWERLLAAEHVTSKAPSAWLPHLLARPGGGDALARLLTLWDSRPHALYHRQEVEELAPAIPEETRARAFGELLRALGRIEEEERAAGEPAQPYLRQQIAQIAVALAPARGDATLLLETILGAPIDTASEGEPAAHDTAASYLSDVLARWPIDDALRATLVEARRAEQPGRWRRIGRDVWESLGPDPVLRERARRALDDESAHVRSRAVVELLGPLHDPAEDGTVLDVARRLYARPELRLGVIYRDLLLDEARRDLEEGRLGLEEALAVLLRTKTEQQTDAMWSAARALRDAPTEDGKPRLAALFNTLMIRAGSEWEPSDLAYVRAVAEEAFTSPEAARHIRFVVATLDAVDAPESAELLAELDARAITPELKKELAEGRKLAEALRHLRA